MASTVYKTENCFGDVMRGQAPSCVGTGHMLQLQCASWYTQSRLRHKNVLKRGIEN